MSQFYVYVLVQYQIHVWYLGGIYYQFLFLMNRVSDYTFIEGLDCKKGICSIFQGIKCGGCLGQQFISSTTGGIIFLFMIKSIFGLSVLSQLHRLGAGVVHGSDMGFDLYPKISFQNGNWKQPFLYKNQVPKYLLQRLKYYYYKLHC